MSMNWDKYIVKAISNGFYEGSIPLRVSANEFYTRLKGLTDDKTNCFVGDKLENGGFSLLYFPPFSRKLLWIKMQGFIFEDSIYYSFIGIRTFRTIEFEQNRLVEKLKELCE